MSCLSPEDPDSLLRHCGRQTFGSGYSVSLMPLRHGGTLNSHRPTSSLAWLVEGQERWGGPCPPSGYSPLNWGGAEQNRTVTCMVL
ncbi:hypothetical protein TNCV_2024621 [Trichonephila clavipes]|nr:hypothetical protein TNCV_2024621 [Trichonephila clavipes]